MSFAIYQILDVLLFQTSNLWLDLLVGELLLRYTELTAVVVNVPDDGNVPPGVAGDSPFASSIRVRL
jgi:hypothetical protein